MKFSLSKKDLLRAINPVIRAINTRVTLPVLNNILIETKDKGLCFTATNLEITIQTTCRADIEKKGSITIPAKIFSSYISLLSGDKIIGEMTENFSLKIIAGSSKTEIKGITADEFPVIPDFIAETRFNLAAPVLAKALDQVIFAASIDPTRPILNSVLFLVQKDFLKIAATNSYQLSEKKLPLFEKQLEEIKIIIPTRAAIELAALLSKEAETVEIQINKNQAKFQVVHTQFTTRLIDGKYPDYTQIIPEKSDIKVTVPTEDFNNALKRTNLFTDQNSGKAKIKIEFDRILILANTGQVGQDEIELPARVEGGTTEVAVNINYMVNMMSHISATELELEFIDSIRPIKIRPIKDKNYLYVIMPLKLN